MFSSRYTYRLLGYKKQPRRTTFYYSPEPKLQSVCSDPRPNESSQTMQITNGHEHEKREQDQQWIRANIDRLELHAAEQFRLQGRGALVVDDCIPGERSLYYRPVTRMPEQGDVKQMVADYSPLSQIVIVFLKADDVDPYVLTVAQWRATSVQ
jgi:hypothetical protein